MATGRTVKKHARFYAGGYDLSGYARSFGPLDCSFDFPDLTTLTDEVKCGLPNQATLGVGELKAVMDNTASGLHAVFNAPGSPHAVMCPIGIRAAPVNGDPVYCGKFAQGAYKSYDDGGAILVSLPWSEWDASELVNYQQPWGVLLHAKGAETGANSAAGINCLAATAKGGWLMYQIFAANTAGATATISIDDSANNSDWTALSGATSGEIDVGTSPVAGIVALSTTATVRQYLRWQVTLGTATSVTFALAFMRGK